MQITSFIDRTTSAGSRLLIHTDCRSETVYVNTLDVADCLLDKNHFTMLNFAMVLSGTVACIDFFKGRGAKKGT